MKKALLFAWLVASALLLVATLVLSYISVMMGAVHWDWGLSLGLGAGFLALGAGCAWMCRRAYALLKRA